MPEESRSLLAAGDALAAHLLDALSPLRFEEAADDGDRRVGYRIRYSAVVERNLASPNQFPEGEERDEEIGMIREIGRLQPQIEDPQRRIT